MGSAVLNHSCSITVMSQLRRKRSITDLVSLAAMAGPRAQQKSILKSLDPKKKFKRNVHLKFKDQCKTSHPYLNFFSKDSR